MTQQLVAPRAVAPTENRRPGPTSYLWLVWRQHGGVLVAAAAVTLAICTALLFAGRMLSSIHCTADPFGSVGMLSPSGCGSVASWNLHLYEAARWLLRATVLLPAVLGVLWGAPLVSREHETGTHELAWGQGVSARQWLRAKLLVLSAVGSLLCLATWGCARPVAESLARLEAVGRFGWEDFGTLAPLTVAYLLAALALGVLCGVLTKKTLPALVLAATVCLGLGVGAADVLRPHYMAPVVLHGAIGDDLFTVTGDPLVVAGGWADVHGKPVRGYPGACDPDNSVCLHAHGIYSRYISYQPGSREAEFQLIEAGLALLVAAGCAALAVSCVGRGFGVAR